VDPEEEQAGRPDIGVSADVDSARACSCAGVNTDREGSAPIRCTALTSWLIATRKTPVYTSLNRAASRETPRLTGLKTRYSAQAATTSSATTRNRLTMPSRNTPSEALTSCAVRAASPCVTTL
jgi:hypothetical protein